MCPPDDLASMLASPPSLLCRSDVFSMIGTLFLWLYWCAPTAGPGVHGVSAAASPDT